MPHKFRFHPRGLSGRALGWTLGGLDRMGQGLGLGTVPASRVLTRRSLWGRLPRQPLPPAHDSRRLLALTFDLDYQADTDALTPLVELVGRVEATMSVVSIGRLVELDPQPYQRAVAAGHEIVNHTWSHPDNPVLNPHRQFWDLSEDEMAEEIGRGQEVFEKLLGVRPTGFRTPHFKDAHRMLRALGRFPEIRYISSALASRSPLAVPYYPAAVPVAGQDSLHYSSVRTEDNDPLLMIPLTPCPEHAWSPFCSYHAIRRPANPAKGSGMHTLAEFADLWQRMLNRAWEDRFACVYFDPLDVMADGQTATTFESMLRWAREQGWTLTTLEEVERVWSRAARETGRAGAA